MTCEIRVNGFRDSADYNEYVFRFIIGENSEHSLNGNVKYGSYEKGNIL